MRAPLRTLAGLWLGLTLPASAGVAALVGPGRAGRAAAADAGWIERAGPLDPRAAPCRGGA